MTAGWLVIVPAFVLHLVATPAYGAYAQSELNQVWAADGAPVPVRSYEAPPLAD
jgi:hypothetical protein